METFTQILNLIQLQRGHGSKKNNLADVKATARRLGADKAAFKIIHIAGTNGKGTTATLLALALKNAGFKAGLFTSPHIKNVTERIQINGKQISKSDFTLYVSKVLKAETKPLKFFEVLTLAALLYFKDKAVTHAVIEVGIGGKFDSTNIVSPALTIITSIGIDHADILGKTHSAVAAQKAGIIKKNVPCITASLKPAAKKVILKTAKIKRAALITLGPVKVNSVDYKKRCISFSYGGNLFCLALLNPVAARNAALVLEAAKYLNIPLNACKKAFKDIKMPWRFEVVRLGKKTIIKEGAHNIDALNEFLKAYQSSPYHSGDNTLIFASSLDKDYKAAAKLLAAHFGNIVLTSVSGGRAAPPETLQKYFKKGRPVAPKQISRACLSKIPGNIVVLGSFYLSSEIPSIPS